MTKISRIAMLVAVLLIWVSLPVMAESDKYNLDNFGWRVVESNGRGSLFFQSSPRGEFMYGHKFYTGDRIYVNLYWKEDGYAIAYEDGVYGYVDASYIDWGDASTTAYKTGDYIGSMRVIKCDEWVSLRLRPSTSADRIAKVPKGAVVEAHYHDKLWMKCDYDGQQGYILSEFLESIGDDSSINSVGWFNAIEGGDSANGSTSLNIAPDAFPLTFSTSGFGWGSDVVINEDMTFTGDYHYRDEDEWTFSGALDDIQRIDDYTYEMTVGDFSSEGKGEFGDVMGYRHWLRLYLPGADVNTIDNLYATDNIGFGRAENYLYSENGKMTVYVLCNLTSGNGFVTMGEE